MYSFDQVGLCCGSLVQADFRTLLESASRAGFSSISMWPTLFNAALDSGVSEQDMRTMLDDNGIVITELDPYCAWFPFEIDPEDIAAAFYAFNEEDFYRIADALGARTLNVIQQGEAPLNEARRVELLAALCERAAAHDLRVTVEFLPWSPIPSLAAAVNLVKSVGANMGINIDTWHHFRSGGTVAQLAEIDPNLVAAVQFNDVAAEPWDNPLEETSVGRLMPGAGVSDSVAVLRALHGAGVTAAINVEVFSAELMGLPAEEAAQKMADSMRVVLQQAASN